MRYLIKRMKNTLLFVGVWWALLIPCFYLAIMYIVITVGDLNWSELIMFWSIYTVIHSIILLWFKLRLKNTEVGYKYAYMYITYNRVKLDVYYAVLFAIICLIIDLI